MYSWLANKLPVLRKHDYKRASHSCDKEIQLLRCLWEIRSSQYKLSNARHLHSDPFDPKEPSQAVTLQEWLPVKKNPSRLISTFQIRLNFWYSLCPLHSSQHYFDKFPLCPLLAAVMSSWTTLTWLAHCFEVNVKVCTKSARALPKKVLGHVSS